MKVYVLSLIFDFSFYSPPIPTPNSLIILLSQDLTGSLKIPIDDAILSVNRSIIRPRIIPTAENVILSLLIFLLIFVLFVNKFIKLQILTIIRTIVIKTSKYVRT